MWTEERLNKMLTTPSEALSGELGRLEGDILVLGAGGKMGPTLCVLAKNALRAAGVEKRVIAVSRFSDPLDVYKRQPRTHHTARAWAAPAEKYARHPPARP